MDAKSSSTMSLETSKIVNPVDIYISVVNCYQREL